MVVSVAGQQQAQQEEACQAWAYHLAKDRCKVDHDSKNQFDWSLRSNTTTHRRTPN